MFSIRNRKTSSSVSLQSREKKNWEYYNPPEDHSAVQFCLDSSLHGLQYVTQKNRHFCERSFWIIAFLLSVVWAGLLIHTLWETYTDAPVVTVINPETLELWRLPFPAVTFCNVNKIKKSKKEEYERNLYSAKYTNNDTKYLESLAAIADLEDICAVDTFAKRMFDKTFYPYTSHFQKFKTDFKKRRLDYDPFYNPAKRLLDGSHDCNEMLFFCMWQDEVYNCSELFRPIVTDFGYCCTFNMIPASLLMKNFNHSTDSLDNTNDTENEEVKKWEEAELTSENLIVPFHPEMHSNRRYPIRQTFPSRATGLSVMLEPNLKEYFCTSLDSEGFAVGLNLPIDYPRMRDHGMLVQPGKETFIKIRPEITISQESTRKFDIKKRYCVFENDTAHTRLKYYTKYSAKNCYEECVSDAILERCKCVRYYMPRSPDTLICMPGSDTLCATIVEKHSYAQKGRDCYYCYHTCTDIQYHAEMTSLRIPKNYFSQLFEADPKRNFTNDMAIVHLYFDQPAYQTRMRKEVFTVIELISSTGGLLGLCMGFSMLSLLEIIYFCTIRLYFIYRRKCIEKAITKTEDLTMAPNYGESKQSHESNVVKLWSVSEVINK